MCGICAIVGGTSERSSAENDIRRMIGTLTHRGPDAQGVKVFGEGDPGVALGHTRLSIIDLSGGSQPMSNEDGTVWISYNGEIYNHRQLRRELESRGHRYLTRSDTETVVHAYEEWGGECVHRLRGMFAFVIWDSRRRELFAARDRLGIKPLYYMSSDETLICASEIKALVASNRYRPEINRAAVPELVTFGYIAGEQTLFRDVKKLLPGHRMTWRQGALNLEQYWDVPRPQRRSETTSEDDFIGEFTAIFRECVHMRLMADVPLGVFLSGGLDSSAIAATMAREMSEPLKTFSVGFESQYYSEFDFAREVSRSINADHHEVVLRPDDFLASLPSLIWHEDEPIRNSSSIALYHVARLAQDHVKVVLTGEGSDELFAGYSRYWATLFNRRWGSKYDRVVPKWIRERFVRRTLWNWPLPLSLRKKLSHTFLNHSQTPEELIFDNFHAICPRRLHRDLFTGEFYESVIDIDPYGDSVGLYNGRCGTDELDRMLYVDQKTYLVELLMKQDNMSMAASIESRVPFLDHEMVEFAAQVPSRMKLRGRKEKYLVRQAMRRLLPASVITREKMGFPVPIDHWLRHGFANVFRGVLLSDRARQRSIFDGTFIERLLNENTRRTRDHTDLLWTALNFELWARIFIDGDSASTASNELNEIQRENRRADTIRAFPPKSEQLSSVST